MFQATHRFAFVCILLQIREKTYQKPVCFSRFINSVLPNKQWTIFQYLIVDFIDKQISIIMQIGRAHV